MPTSLDRPPPALVSVVIAVRNGAATLPAQLEALAAQHFEGWWEVVVADNGSSDDTVATALRWSDRLPLLRVVDAGARRGVAHARNVGAAAANGDFVVMCDADDVVAPGWLQAMAEAASGSDVVGGRLEDDRGAGTIGARHAADRLPVALDFLPYAVTANLGARSDVISALGGWRTDYTHGGEDIDFSWRAHRASFLVSFAPGAVVAYRYRSGSRASARQAHQWGIAHAQLYRDHRGDGAAARAPAAVRRVWWWIASRAPVALLVPGRRAAWRRTLAFNTGLLRGSIRFRVVCA